MKKHQAMILSVMMAAVLGFAEKSKASDEESCRPTHESLGKRVIFMQRYYSRGYSYDDWSTGFLLGWNPDGSFVVERNSFFPEDRLKTLNEDEFSLEEERPSSGLQVGDPVLYFGRTRGQVTVTFCNQVVCVKSDGAGHSECMKASQLTRLRRPVASNP